MLVATLEFLVKTHWLFRAMLGAVIGAWLLGFLPESYLKTHKENSAQPAKEPATTYNTINNINTNSGIITQGQIGNNTIVNQAVLHEEDSIYQENKKIAEIQNPSIDETSGTITFGMMALQAYPKVDKLLQYKSYFIECPNIPTQKPNEYVGRVSIAISGIQCKIIKKK